MNTKFNTTGLAFLLALQELDSPLSEAEKRNLADIGDQLDVQPKAWKSVTEPLLLKIIEANSQLNQRYQFYQSQLDAAGEISRDLLPTEAEIRQLFPVNSPFAIRGFEPDSEPTGYESQISNIVIAVSRSENPEKEVKKLTFLDKVKQSLGRASQ